MAEQEGMMTRPTMRFPWPGVLFGVLMWLALGLIVFGFFGCRNVGVSQQVPTSLPVLAVSEQRDSIVADAARQIGIPIVVAIAVSHIENWTGDSMAVSNKGAVGLMQVIPKIWQHEFEEDCGCGSVFPRKRNACLGVHILKRYHDKHKTWERALRAYHGSNDNPQGRDYITAFMEAAIGAIVELHKPTLKEGA